MNRIGSITFAVLLAACGGGGGYAGGGTVTGPPNPAPVANSVSIADNYFSPGTLTATRSSGSVTVTWTWTGANSHNVTFDSGGQNSSTQRTGTFSATFTAPGTYTYICTVHGRAVMSGTITVQ